MAVTSRLLDDLARLLTDAVGVASAARGEVQANARGLAERILRDLDVVSREEFEAVRQMAAMARDDAERLSARLDVIERRFDPPGAVGGIDGAGGAP